VLDVRLACDERRILAARVALPSHTAGILGRRALSSRRFARLDATPDFRHELQGPADEQSPLTLLDAVAAVVDDFAPFAIDIRAPGSMRVYFSSEADRDAARAAVTAVCGPRVQTSATSVPAPQPA